MGDPSTWDGADALHPFDDAITLTPSGDNTYTGETSPAYQNMVGPYGGITAATLLQAVQQHPERLGVPVSLTVNYAGPVADGKFTVTARPARTNRSTQHWSLELTQDDTVVTTATAVYAVRRETWAATETVMPEFPAPEDAALTPMPDFVQWAKNYEMRFLEGLLPTVEGAESPDSTTTLWVRDSPARELDFPALASLCDVFYPRVFLRRGQAMPAGTITLTIYFHADAAALEAQGDRPVLARARSNRFGHGYFDQSAQLWGRDGALLATTHQLVYFKG
ncbi:acyl-CoA thioesterase [Saccharomonospora sp. CUA-673]|uniref:acyl-CoA thioesterase n=1 Tax=Saccharomonospora sp. CUA-673 TaxID=1904969 RepID=UPI00095C3E0F|nr:thioesterase family protein [Saccharomonospora sp. CUA-673]OLT43092.1 acyl-CoA thioesterase [Saccharomonospora sp. CUA-673]